MTTTLSRVAVGTTLATTLVACSANNPPPKSPESAGSPAAEAPAATAPAQQPYPQPGQPGIPGYPQGQYPGLPAASGNYAPAPPPSTPSADANGPVRISREFDTAERELAVAAGDCRNACRALGSMDRAAGRICTLAQEKNRCDEATGKVRDARDKVKNSCGMCPDVSTDRNAPVPSH